MSLEEKTLYYNRAKQLFNRLWKNFIFLIRLKFFFYKMKRVQKMKLTDKNVDKALDIMIEYSCLILDAIDYFENNKKEDEEWIRLSKSF